MSGFKLKLPDAVTDTNLPILYADPIMSTGSLFLFEPSKSNGDSGTTLITGGKASNIAWKTASNIIGSGTEITLGADVATVGITAASKLEFTGKKGVHFIYSKVSGTANTAWYFDLPTLIRTYLYSNYTTKKLYVSIWGRVTRISDTTTSGFFLLGSNNSLTGNYKILCDVSGNAPVANPPQLGTRVLPNPANVTGNFIRTIATNGKVGNVPTDGNSAFVARVKIGAGSAYGGFEANKAASMIIYKVYIEDLDVSGRTYAEVDALDKALYDEAFAIGGRYYGDTFTDPATLP